jgi:hypothetical protein
MAERCANCGRADLLQAQLATYQCLACGAQTDIATNKVVVPVEKSALTSNAGFPVVELSNGVVEDSTDVPDRRVRDTGPEVVIPKAPEVVVEPRPARVDESYVPAEEPKEDIPDTYADAWGSDGGV